jgi:molybdopterin converting factor small subunit
MYSGRVGCEKYGTCIEKPARLIEILEGLERVFPLLKNGSKGKIADRYGAHYLCISSGRVLRLSDTIKDEDTVEIIPPIMGG